MDKSIDGHCHANCMASRLENHLYPFNCELSIDWTICIEIWHKYLAGIYFPTVTTNMMLCYWSQNKVRLSQLQLQMVTCWTRGINDRTCKYEYYTLLLNCACKIWLIRNHPANFTWWDGILFWSVCECGVHFGVHVFHLANRVDNDQIKGERK